MAGLALFRLLLLLDLLFSDIFAIFPLNLGALAFFNHVLSLHCETLSKLLILEVVVLLEGEDEIEAVARIMELALNIL